uniref:Uncharacterized protein n=1 Tax=Magallana gigas TaxID=29159 RepID=K1PZ86_MAGGI
MSILDPIDTKPADSLGVCHGRLGNTFEVFSELAGKAREVAIGGRGCHDKLIVQN